MPTYKVNWKATIYGSSEIVADSKEEAEEKVKRNEDYDFEWESHYNPDWELDSVEEVPNE